MIYINNLICKGIPTGLREFQRYSGCDVDNYTTEDRNKKMAVLETIAIHTISMEAFRCRLNSFLLGAHGSLGTKTNEKQEERRADLFHF